MRQLLGSDPSPHILRKLFFYQLPSNVRRELALSDQQENLDALARAADRIIAEDRWSKSPGSELRYQSSDPHNSEIDDLRR